MLENNTERPQLSKRERIVYLHNKILPSILATCSISEIYDCFGIIYCLAIFLNIRYKIIQNKSRIHCSNKSVFHFHCVDDYINSLCVHNTIRPPSDVTTLTSMFWAPKLNFKFKVFLLVHLCNRKRRCLHKTGRSWTSRNRNLDGERDDWYITC